MVYVGEIKAGHAPSGMARQLMIANERETEWRVFDYSTNATLGFEYKIYNREKSTLPTDEKGYCHFMYQNRVTA